jgi:signal transduction histidine kinase
VNLGAQSGLLAAIVAAAVAISVLLRVRRGPLSALFTLFSANLFVHYLASFFEHLTRHPFWTRLDLMAAALLPVTALSFFGHFLWQRPSLPNRFLRPAYVVSGLLAAFLFTPWSEHPAATVAIVTYAFAGVYLCAYLMLQRHRELESRRERTRLQYLVVFLLVAVSFMLLGAFPPLEFLRSWADLISVFFLYFVSQSLMKYRLLDLQELLGRMLTLTLVGLLLAMISGLLALWAGGSAGVSLFHTFLAALVIFILFEPLRDKVEVLTGRLIFQERIELRRKLEALRREIANILELPRMTAVLLDTLYESLRVSHASLYLIEEAGTGYRLAGHRGTQPPERIDTAAHRALFEQLKKTPSVLLAETFERRLEQAPVPEAELPPEAEQARQVLESLRSIPAGICIPLSASGELVGLWMLHDDKGLENYSTEEIARLMAVGEQAAINFENARVFEHQRERDRLAALGEMAAGLAHEIRNPLGAIKGAAQFLQPEAADQESAEILRVIVEETDRLNHVVDQFLGYARPFKAQLKATDVNKVVEHSLKLVAADLEKHGLVVQTQLAAGLPQPDGSEQQLTQVLLNLLKNAAEAMGPGGRLMVRTSQRTASPFLRLRPGRRPVTVQIEVSDTGAGIPPEQLTRVFLPFFTTKEKGTGLGLAICQRIVEHHGGALQVRSRPGEGSTFTITLPCPAPADRPPEAPPGAPASG